MNPAGAAQLVIPCTDLDASIAFYTVTLGFRLDMTMPADAPRVAVVSASGLALRLELADTANAGHAPTLRLSGNGAWLAGFDAREFDAPDGVSIVLVDDDAPASLPTDAGSEFQLCRADEGASATGRAGMVYRDLIPGRLGGRYIASHIRIPDGGPVPDYVHYHRVRFQVIYCLRGWVRVVYEDQGEPFVMRAGDCVLQPPTIRHRVLEASPGLEVLEIGGPAEHETLREHGFDLPTPQLQPNRRFGGQRFVRHVAADALWRSCAEGRFEYRDTGISNATDGLADVRVLRATPGVVDAGFTARVEPDAFRFLSVLKGPLVLQGEAFGTHRLDTGDACLIPTGAQYRLDGAPGCEVLDVTLPSGCGVPD